MWTRQLGHERASHRPVMIAVNPGSMLGTKMVADAYGVAGGDISIGAEILERAALDESFADASGEYFDNDSGRFASPHHEALNPGKCAAVVEAIQSVLANID